jgi:hypothetical protein
MNTTKLYQIITENKNGIEAGVYDVLLGIVKEEIAKEAEKSAGRKPNVRSAVKKFLGDEYRPYLQKASIQEINGKTYYGYCDGFKLAWSPVDFNLGVNENGTGMNWKNLLDSYGNKARTAVTINKADVIQFIKEHRGERCPYTIRTESGYEVDFNPEYLKNCMDFTETTTIYIEEDHHCAPAFFHNEAEDRHALVLPIRR